MSSAGPWGPMQALAPWIGYSISLVLSFPISIMRIMVVSTSQGCYKESKE